MVLKEEIINEKFRAIGLTSRLDSRQRITLGQALVLLGKADKHRIDGFEILIGTTGDILLRPRTSLPIRELWVHQNKEARQTLQKGLADAAAGRITRVKNLKKFVDRL
jgi:hypothetical protein